MYGLLCVLLLTASHPWRHYASLVVDSNHHHAVLLLLLLSCLPRQVYDAGSGVLPLSKSDVAAADLLWEELDAATGGWLTAARTLLTDLTNSSALLVTHVLVGNSQLVPLLGKLMMFKLDTLFDINQVYSAAAVPKIACFKRIAAKFGPKAR